MMNKEKIFFKIKNSVFVKLLLILIAAGILVHFLIGAFFHVYFKRANDKKIINNFLIYSDYIINDIGHPPDVTKAKQLSLKTSIDMIITGPNVNWESSKNLKIKCKRDIIYHVYKNSKFGRCRSDFILVIEKNGYTYKFINRHLRITRGMGPVLMLFIFLFVIILLLTYIAIRYVLRPIKLLQTGVQKLAEGELDIKVPIKTSDELGELTNSFNHMTIRIKEMLMSREQLLRDVSHELRSPLTRIKVALEFLKTSDTKESITADISEVEKMITEILESEQLDSNNSIKLEQANSFELISSVIKNSNLNSKNIEINEKLKKCNLNVDVMKTKIVIRNLLENALKYSEKSRKPIEVSCDQSENKTEIKIQDYGTGIPKENLPFIFEPFYRVDPSRSRKTGGYGLGLNICKKIIDAHGGEILISSEENKGTEVRIIFNQ